MGGVGGSSCRLCFIQATLHSYTCIAVMNLQVVETLCKQVTVSTNPSHPSQIEEEFSVADETDIDLDDFSQDEKSEGQVSLKHELALSKHEMSQSRQESKSDGSESSFSASKTMSELKELMSEPSKRFRSSSGTSCFFLIR